MADTTAGDNDVSPTPSCAQELPLVSCVVGTKDEERVIRDLLVSLKAQTYPNIEIIVVDNPRTTDATREIAREFTDKVYVKGYERSVQRNFGVEKAAGEYVLILDADMQLTPTVVEDCVELAEEMEVGGIIIPERSIGEHYWARVKAEERSWYVGEDAIEAERFFAKAVFEQVGGFTTDLTGPEDWDLARRTRELGPHGRTDSYILHNEGRTSLGAMMRKKFYYAKGFSSYASNGEGKVLGQQSIYFLRPSVLRNVFRFWRDPLVYPGIWIMFLSQTLAAGLGFIAGKLSARKAES
jgi:glycosyltransferase involved in cell wall biosynthesis